MRGKERIGGLTNVVRAEATLDECARILGILSMCAPPDLKKDVGKLRLAVTEAVTKLELARLRLRDEERSVLQLLKEARTALRDELDAAGADEVKQHSTLSAHARVHDRIQHHLDTIAERDARSTVDGAVAIVKRKRS